MQVVDGNKFLENGPWVRQIPQNSLVEPATLCNMLTVVFTECSLSLKKRVTSYSHGVFTIASVLRSQAAALLFPLLTSVFTTAPGGPVFSPPTMGFSLCHHVHHACHVVLTVTALYSLLTPSDNVLFPTWNCEFIFYIWTSSCPHGVPCISQKRPHSWFGIGLGVYTYQSVTSRMFTLPFPD